MQKLEIFPGVFADPGSNSYPLHRCVPGVLCARPIKNVPARAGWWCDRQNLAASLQIFGRTNSAARMRKNLLLPQMILLRFSNAG